MQKVLIVTVVVLVCLPVLLSAGKGGGRRAKGRRGGEGGGEAANQRKDCGQWVEGPCVPKNNAACGAGTQNKTRTGDNCPVKEKIGRCNVPCSGAQAGAGGGAGTRPAGGRGKTKAAKCKYTKGDWSSCDPTTNTKTRTLTLKTRRNAAPSTECEQTKVDTRKCAAPARKNRRGPGAQ